VVTDGPIANWTCRTLGMHHSVRAKTHSKGHEPFYARRTVTAGLGVIPPTPKAPTAYHRGEARIKRLYFTIQKDSSELWCIKGIACRNYHRLTSPDALRPAFCTNY
jgi:hypothetical protein